MINTGPFFFHPSFCKGFVNPRFSPWTDGRMAQLGKGKLISTSGEWNSVGEEGEEEGRERDEVAREDWRIASTTFY